jgi:sugar transferase (PEP-CTERM/EpsH1 system associated)
MRLLFLTPQLPHPPRQGTAIRNWGLIKSLSARHAITLLTFAERDEALSPELKAACERIETVPLPPARTPGQRLRHLLLSPLPDLAHRLASPEFGARLDSVLRANSFDALFVEGLELALHLSSLLSPPPSIVFDAHNCETRLQRRAFQNDLRTPGRWLAALYSLIQSRKLARFEAEACRRAAYVTCVSAEDAAALRTLVPDLTPVIIPNGIFLSDYGRQTSSPTTRLLDHSTTRLVFTGKMDYRPNVDAALWFANDIFPLIQREAPQAQFVIVGQKPTRAVQRLSERPGLVVTGAVEDAQPHIAGAAVYVAPLRMGGGTRFKLLEALALKRPIVSTTLGAEGFALKDGRELLLADGVQDFANAVITLLHDGAQRKALAEAGYEFVKGYDWERIAPEVEKLLASRT